MIHRVVWDLEGEGAEIIPKAKVDTGNPTEGPLVPPLLILLMMVGGAALQITAKFFLRRSFGVVAAMLALGRNHEALLLCFVLAAALAGEIVTAEDKRRYLHERRGVLATMGIVAIALLAVPLLLTVQFAALSNRPEVPLDKALEASLYPANLASLAVANVLGSLETTQVYWGPNFDTLPEVGATDRSFNYLFVGAASTVVMLWFGIAGGWMARRGTRLMTAVLAVALLYALGRYTPVYALAFEYVPGVHLFRRPIDGTFVLVAAFALIAGQLLADYVREGTPRVARWRVAAVGLCALGVVGWAVAFSEQTHHGWASLWEAVKVAPLAVITSPASSTRSRRSASAATT